MPKKPQSTQHERFVQAARDVETDEDPYAFKERLKRLMKAPPPKKQETPKKKRRP